MSPLIIRHLAPADLPQVRALCQGVAVSATGALGVKASACRTGVLYLCGGIAASLMIPAPAWFIALDLLLAYLPMAWLAVWLGTRLAQR